ncbi:unnamed protein product [Onchocerca flexuosa]|uniref:IlGF domain-containing protein n=1 Tax=Onchocerca flexuosa TaxID=387005 RepID=A0A183H9R6_9BILA|nr:unnamed protein product [Onchocerca flexuosa]
MHLSRLINTSLVILKTEIIAAQNFGSLVLCPPGGQSFATAYMMACEMKKRRRKKRDIGNPMRPATLKEVQNICCEVGCELRDLLNYCDPFDWFDN